MTKATKRPKWRRFGRMGRIPMGGIRMRCGIRPAPRRMCSGGISRSMGCCWIRCAGQNRRDSRSFDALRFAQDDSRLLDLRMQRFHVGHRLCGRFADLGAGDCPGDWAERSCGLKRITCACCGGCGLRRGSGLRWRRERRRAIRSLAPQIAAVSRERVRDELTKMLTEGRARRAFELLDETGLLEEVLPEIARMKGVEQPPQFHPEGDVWVHTLGLLEQLERGLPGDAGLGRAAARCGQAADVPARAGSDPL